MNENSEAIKAEFTKQAPLFNAYKITPAKRAFNLAAIELMNLKGAENVPEVAAGTCAFGKMFARHVG